jgi:hypothetical protein
MAITNTITQQKHTRLKNYLVMLDSDTLNDACYYIEPEYEYSPKEIEKIKEFINEKIKSVEYKSTSTPMLKEMEDLYIVWRGMRNGTI